MKRIFVAAVALAILAVFISSAEAAIKIEIAEVQNGAAYVKGNGAQNGAQITWDGNAVTTANKNNGGFLFNGVVPADCVGTLSDGVSTIQVVVLDCTPVSAAPAPVPRTGQTTSYAARDDGALRKGVALPTPRFTDNNNGTITDNLTGLIWSKTANCFSNQTWELAMSAANGLHSGECGLTDGSIAGDWRLPNIKELFSLVDYEFHQPALSNAAGTGQATWSDPFTNFTVAVGY